MLPCLLVVADAHGENFSCVILQGLSIAAVPDLLDGRFGVFVPFEFQHQGGKLCMEGTGQEYQISEALSRRKFAEYLVLLPGAVKGQGEGIGKGVFVIVLDMAGYRLRK